MSQYLEGLLREPLKDFLLDDAMYQRAFDRFEGMTHIDQENGRWAPAGCFAWRYEFDEKGPSAQIRDEISESGENWPPLKAGMFRGSLSRANEVKSRLDAFISEVACHL
jgi:hypothetical protein